MPKASVVCMSLCTPLHDRMRLSLKLLHCYIYARSTMSGVQLRKHGFVYCCREGCVCSLGAVGMEDGIPIQSKLEASWHVGFVLG